MKLKWTKIVCVVCGQKFERKSSSKIQVCSGHCAKKLSSEKAKPPMDTFIDKHILSEHKRTVFSCSGSAESEINNVYYDEGGNLALSVCISGRVGAFSRALHLGSPVVS